MREVFPRLCTWLQGEKIPLCTVNHVCPGLNKKAKKHGFDPIIKVFVVFFSLSNLTPCDLWTTSSESFDWLVLWRNGNHWLSALFSNRIRCEPLKEPIVFSPKGMIWTEFAPSLTEGLRLSSCFGRGHRQLNQQKDQRCAVCVVLRWDLWPGTLRPRGSHCWKYSPFFRPFYVKARESECALVWVKHANTSTQPLHRRFYLFVLSTRSR